MPKKSKANKLANPVKSQDMPVTQKQFKDFRREFSNKFTSLELKMDSRFKERDSRFDKIDARFKEQDARFDKIDSQFSEIRSDLQRVLVLVEEQNQRNKLVLDSYSLMYEAHKRLEAKVDKEY